MILIPEGVNKFPRGKQNKRSWSWPLLQGTNLSENNRESVEIWLIGGWIRFYAEGIARAQRRQFVAAPKKVWGTSTGNVVVVNNAFKVSLGCGHVSLCLYSGEAILSPLCASTQYRPTSYSEFRGCDAVECC